MPHQALGFLLRTLREKRGLSLREAAQLANTDHAYIHRLETGAREAPSQEMVAKLNKVMKPSKREGEMLAFLAEHPDTDPAWVEACLNDPTIPFRDFAAVAAAVYRSTSRPDYARVLARIRAILGEEKDRG